MNDFEEKKEVQEHANDAPSYRKFARDKRVRTVSTVRVEPVSRRNNAESPDRDGRNFNRDDRYSGRSYDSDRPSQRPQRASYNPNFTRDNRPAFQSERPARRDFDRDYNRDSDRRDGQPQRRFEHDYNRSDEQRPHRQYQDRSQYGGENGYRQRPEHSDRYEGGYRPRSGNTYRPRTERPEGERRSYNGERQPAYRPYDREGQPSRFNRDGQAAPRGFDREQGGEARRNFNRDGQRTARFDRDGQGGGYRDGGNQRGYGRDDRKGGFQNRKPAVKRAPKKKVVFGAGEIPESYPRFAAPKQEGEIRLNRYISQSGLCSRREADELIASGAVTVNGATVTEMGVKVQPTDEVCVNSARVVSEKKVYIILNKPKGYVTTVEDDHAAKTVMDIVKGACTERIYPVGRLDKNSLGVLLLTNDGDLTKTLTHPSYEKRKIYQVTVDKQLTKADMEHMVEGLTLDDGFVQADEVSYVNESKKEIGIEIHSGRNRIVRRMFEKLGYTVTKLDRVYFAGLTKKNLKRGQWRFLTPQEVAMLKSGLYE